MDEIRQGPYRNNDLRAKRTPSKVVSEAFGFLNNKSYADHDGVVRIHSSYSEPVLNYVDQPENLGVNIQADVYIPEESEFTIVTSVEKSPLAHHKSPPDKGKISSYSHSSNTKLVNDRRESLPIISTTATSFTNETNHVNHKKEELGVLRNKEGETLDGIGDKTEFTIVDFVEDHNKRKLDDIYTAEPTSTEKSSGNKITNDLKDTLQVSVGKTVSEKEENRKSINIDGEVVELRSPEMKPRSPRAPTWRQNQMVVSEAFDFLQDLEGGDTVSVIHVPVDDKADRNSEGEFMNPNGNNEGSYIATGNKDLINKNQKNMNKSAKDVELHQIIDPKTQVPQKAFGNKSEKSNSFGKPYELSPIGRSTFEKQSVSDADSSSNSLGGLSTGTEQDDQLGELEVSRLRQRRKSPRKEADDDDDADSSDEDRGVYRESFRKSTWLYVGDSSDVSSKGGSSKESGYISLADLNIKGTDNDSVFGDDQESLSPSPTTKASHARTESVSTTVSEREFRNAYSHVSKRLVKRADSQQEYKRFSSKFYDHEKVFIIEKDDSSGYGIHIIDSRPAVITEVDEGSPGARAGVREGQIVISINNVNVLEHDHDDIIKLVQENSKKLVLEVGCSDVAHIRDLEIPIVTGYLMKQTSAILFKSWKRRFFILRRDNCLYYYKTEKDNDPLGAMPLTGYTVSRHGDPNKFGFKAGKFDNRTYYFMADTREEMAKWVGALNEAALRSKHKKDTWLDVTANNVGLPALEIRKPDCSGYLFKMGRVTKRWRKHYCVLKDACIYHYKNSSSKEAIGVAHLHGYTVDPGGSPGKKLSFCLLPPDPQMRTFSFYSDNETDKARWVEALQTSIQKWVKVG